MDEKATSSLPAIPHRRLGKTDIHVSVLGFGASPLGGTFSADVSEEEGIAAVHQAFAAGINYFDTSPYYGATKSERVLGRALQGLPRDQVVISTKVGRYGDGEENFDFSCARVEASIAESLERLQVSYIDIVFCHDIEFGDLNQVINEALPTLAKLKAQGKVRAVGFSCLPLATIKYVLDRVPQGAVDCVLSYCHNGLNDSTLFEFLPYLESKGVGCIAASPLSMGLLTMQGPPAWHPAPGDIKAACAAAAQHAHARGSDICRLGLSFALRESRVASTLVGMSEPSVVAANTTCALRALGLCADPDAAKDAEVAQEVAGLLQVVQGKTWPSGKPLPS